MEVVAMFSRTFSKNLAEKNKEKWQGKKWMYIHLALDYVNTLPKKKKNQICLFQSEIIPR